MHYWTFRPRVFGVCFQFWAGISGERARKCWWLHCRAERSFLEELEQSSSSFTTGNEMMELKQLIFWFASRYSLLSVMGPNSRQNGASVNGFAFCCPNVTLSMLNSALFSYMLSPRWIYPEMLQDFNLSAATVTWKQSQTTAGLTKVLVGGWGSGFIHADFMWPGLRKEVKHQKRLGSHDRGSIFFSKPHLLFHVWTKQTWAEPLKSAAACYLWRWSLAKTGVSSLNNTSGWRSPQHHGWHQQLRSAQALHQASHSGKPVSQSSAAQPP